MTLLNMHKKNQGTQTLVLFIMIRYRFSQKRLDTYYSKGPFPKKA